MNYAIGMIRNKYNDLSITDIESLSINQYTTYLKNAINLISADAGGEVKFVDEDTKEEDLRSRLQQLKAEAEARKNGR